MFVIGACLWEKGFACLKAGVVFPPSPTSEQFVFLRAHLASVLSTHPPPETLPHPPLESPLSTAGRGQPCSAVPWVRGGRRGALTQQAQEPAI